MSDEDILLDAKLSKAAYSQAPEVDGWKRDEQLSNINRSVYSKDGKAKVAFRGTDLSSKKTRWDDLGTDLLIGLGLQDLSSRMKNAKKTTDLAAQKYGVNNVSLTGHSLGGTQALYVNRKRGLATNAFNAGISPIDALTRRKYKPNATSYTVGGDIISNFSSRLKGLRTKVIKPTKSFSHSLANFL